MSAVSGSFYRSKIVSLAPRMVLVNKTGFVLEYTQSAYHKIASPSAPVFWLPSAPSSQLTGIDVNASRALHVHDAPPGVITSDPAAHWSPVHVSQALCVCVCVQSQLRFSLSVQWAVANAPQTLQVRLRSAPSIAPLGAWNSVTDYLRAPGGSSLYECSAGVPARPASSDAPSWDWSRPIPSQPGDVTLKLRRFLAGPAVDPPVTGPDPMSASASALGLGLPTARGVSPSQVCLVGPLVSCLHYFYPSPLAHVGLLASSPSGRARCHDVCVADAASFTVASQETHSVRPHHQ